MTTNDLDHNNKLSIFPLSHGDVTGNIASNGPVVLENLRIYCPEHNTETIRGIKLKLHWSIDLHEEKCSVQEPYLSFA